MRYLRRHRSILEDIQNNIFAIHVVIKKFNISVLQKNSVCNVKTLYNKKVVEKWKNIS